MGLNKTQISKQNK